MFSQGWKAAGMIINLALYISTSSLLIYLIHLLLIIIYISPNAKVPHVNTHCSNLKNIQPLFKYVFTKAAVPQLDSVNELFDGDELLLKCSKTHQRQLCISFNKRLMES